jgi:hypothetical protein
MKRFSYRLQKTNEKINYQIVFDLFVKETNPSKITREGHCTETIYEVKEEKKIFTGFLQDCKLYMELHGEGIAP